MIDNLESKISFEIPSRLDLDKLIGSNNYAGFWQTIRNQHEVAARAAAMGSSSTGHTLLGGAIASSGTSAYNASGFDVMHSLHKLVEGASVASSGGSNTIVGAGITTSIVGGTTGGGTEQLLDPTYERFIGDVWVGIVLTLMILSSVFCMCSCFLYHKFRQWQRSVVAARSQTFSTMDLETPPPYDVESLPSYTIVSGLPSYNDAIEQLKQRQEKYASYEPVRVHHPPSVMKLFEAQELLGKEDEMRYNFTSNSSSNTGGNAGDTLASNTNGVSVLPPEATVVAVGSVANVEVPIPTSSAESCSTPARTMMTTTTAAVTTTTTSPSSKSPSAVTTVLSPTNRKKFEICRYEVENERNHDSIS